jgi:glycosyltransferase involved in cell wall biosynthesis
MPMNEGRYAIKKLSSIVVILIQPTGMRERLRVDSPSDAWEHFNAAGQRRLRIAVVTETWPPEVNGVAMTTHRLVSCIAQRHDITLVRTRQRAGRPGIPVAGVVDQVMPAVPLPLYTELRAGLPVTGRLRRQWQRVRPDLVHVITEGPLGWSAIRAARRLKIPVISDFHTNFHQYTKHYGFGIFQLVALSYLRYLHNQTRLTLVPTQALARELSAQGFRDLDILSRGVDTQRFDPKWRCPDLRAQWGAREEDRVLLTVSRIAPEKNLPLALAAFTQVKRRFPGLRMVVVGDGPTRAQAAAQYPDVIFAGMQTGDALSRHYASADLFVFPSLSETFGNVTLEALASGLPVVAFDYAAAQETVVNGRNGFRVDTRDDQGFIAAVENLVGALVRKPAGLSEMRQAARETAARLDWQRICQRYESLLLQIGGEGAHVAQA